jgi:beta-barrel assembly-enhancing protease
MFNLLKQLLHSIGRRRAYAALLAMVMSGSILFTPQPGQAFTLLDLLRRGLPIIQTLSINDQQEVALGIQTNQQIARQIKISQNRELTQYVNNIGQNLARSSARPNLRYTFQVVEDDAVNAFATMGGFVYINTGLLKISDNEAQLASVIGHEIGHITGRHSIEQLKQTLIAQGATSLVGLSQNQLSNIAVNVALRLPMSREMEYDADRRGLENIIRVGYAPSAMPEFMKKLASASSTPAFLSSHPSPPDRVQRLNSLILPQYRAKTDGLDQNSYRQRVQYFFSPKPLSTI